ncbi:MAG: nuclear transport factor 2 family protein [Rubrivivax sp.]|nr:nuclear transport factor 2 family protein [Rubrivivax sp.]
MARHEDPRIARIVDLFEQLSPEGLPQLAEIYTDDARFKDPFNEVQGVPAIRGIFEHMFRTLESPRFVIHDVVVQGSQCFLTWDFVFRLKRPGGEDLVVRGGSHLKLADDGRISLHRDYWDAAEELYEKLPVLGALMRWLKRRVNS